MNKKNALLVTATIFVSLFLVGCTAKDSTTSAPATNTGSVPAANQKQGDTTKTGIITESAGRYYLNVMGQIPEEIESYTLDFAGYIGQTVTVTGQYSGDTLFVGQIN